MIEFYSIYLEGNERCEGLLAESIASAKSFGYKVIPFPGVYGDEIDKQIEQEKLFVYERAGSKIRSKGVLGCFMSHYNLWKKCLTENKAIGVLEYDAVFLNKLPDQILNQFHDYCNLDITRHRFLRKGAKAYLENLKESNNIRVQKLEENTKAKGQNHMKYMNNNHIKGAFGYIIKPSGAEKLIRATKKYGILPADIQPNLRYCDLYYTTESVVQLNAKTLYELGATSHTNHDHIQEK